VSRRLVFALVGLLMLAGVLVIGDRITARYAQNTASDQLAVAAPFDRKPSVTVHGFPFLTQAVGGRYRDIEIAGGGLRLGNIKGASLDAHLHGVHLALGDIFGGSVRELPVDRIDGEVTLPYAELARLIGVAGLTLALGHGGVDVTLSGSVPGIGTVQASGTANVIVDGANLRLKITKLSALSITVPQIVIDQLISSVEVPIELPALPYGLTISSVTAGPEGAVVRGAARNVVLTANG
jgi:hypothetical protein